MEYIFGKRPYNGQEYELVKTVDDTSFSDFSNGHFVTYIYENEDITITHTFRIIRKYQEVIDNQNKYCTFYLIDNHTQDIDRTPPINNQLETHTQTLMAQTVALNEQSEAIDDIIITLLGGQE